MRAWIASLVTADVLTMNGANYGRLAAKFRSGSVSPIAALRFRGRFTRENVASHERVLLRHVVDAGMATRGSIRFAAYDSPLTLPVLRRNEVWIETV